ncbi:MAG: type II secretion system protein [Patescibacteria group bacterium]
MKKSIFSRGFTLVELLVVIAIIGILATLLLLQLNTARSKAKDTKRTTAVSQLRTAAELYYDDNGTYPPDLADATIGKYLATGKAPLDPSTYAAYGYGVNATKTKFQIWAQLENAGNASPATGGVLSNDSDIPAGLTGGTEGTAEAGVGGACTAAGADCVFDLGIN